VSQISSSTRRHRTAPRVSPALGRWAAAARPAGSKAANNDRMRSFTIAKGALGHLRQNLRMLSPGTLRAILPSAGSGG